MNSIKYLFLFIFFHFIATTSAQMEIYNSLEKAIEISQNDKKKLIILRTEFSSIEYSKRSGYPTSASKIDNEIKSTQFQQALKNNFSFAIYDQMESSKEDQHFVKNNYFYDYSPNIIILDSNLDPLSYIQLNMYEDSTGLDKLIYSSLDDFRKDSKAMKSLEDKYEQRSIRSEELINLIQLRANLLLRSKEHWNYFSTKNVPPPKEVDFASVTFLKEDFSIKDPFFKLLMEADESYNEIKSTMVNNLKELREMENDIESFQNLTAIGDSLMQIMFSKDDEVSGFLNTMFPEWQSGMKEANSMKMIEMYSKSGNDSLLTSTAEKYVKSIFDAFEEKKNNFLESQSAMMEFMKDNLITNLPPADTIFNWEDFKKQSIDTQLRSFSSGYSSDLNQICWYYFEIVENKNDLKKAIEWCQESIRLNSGKENNDTMAHLYFKTGNKSKAIEYQTIALQIAQNEGLQAEQIKYYLDELEKFKAH